MGSQTWESREQVSKYTSEDCDLNLGSAKILLPCLLVINIYSDGFSNGTESLHLVSIHGRLKTNSSHVSITEKQYMTWFRHTLIAYSSPRTLLDTHQLQIAAQITYPWIEFVLIV